MAVDMQYCYILGKRREHESGTYFVEKRQKTGKESCFFKIYFEKLAACFVL